MAGSIFQLTRHDVVDDFKIDARQKQPLVHASLQEVDGFLHMGSPLLLNECRDARIFRHLVVEQVGYVLEIIQLYLEITQKQLQDIVCAGGQPLHPFHFLPCDGGDTGEQQFFLVLEKLVECSFGNAEATGYLVHCHTFDTFFAKGLYGNGNNMVSYICAGSGFVFVHGEEYYSYLSVCMFVIRDAKLLQKSEMQKRYSNRIE